MYVLGIDSFQVSTLAVSKTVNTSLRAVINEVISTDCTKGNLRYYIYESLLLLLITYCNPYDLILFL